MTQDTLNDLFVRTQFIQIRRDATPEAMPAIPFHSYQFYNWTDVLSQPTRASCLAALPTAWLVPSSHHPIKTDCDQRAVDVFAELPIMEYALGVIVRIKPKD